MAIFENLHTITMEVGAAIGGNLCVVQTAARTIGLAGAQADPLGVTLEEVTAADFTNGKREIAVAMIGNGGRCGLIASAAIASGAAVGCAANGQIRTAVTGDTIIGRAEEAAGAAGQLITVAIDRKVTPQP